MKKKKSRKEKQILQVEKPLVKSVKEILELLKQNYKYILLVQFLALLVYANIIGGDFVTADDPYMISYVSTHTLGEAINSLEWSRIYPSIIHALFGLNATAFHTASILLHLINIVLAFTLVYLLTHDKKISQIATVIFAVHPTGSEAVAWISGRAYLFLFLFSTSTLIFYLLYRNSKNIKHLITSTLILLFAVAFWRNPWILVTPFILVGYDQLFLSKKINFKNIKQYIPYALIAGVYIATILIGRYEKRVESLENKYKFDPVVTTPLINRIPYTIFMTSKQLVFPWELTIYHEGKIISKPMYAFMVVVTFTVFFLIYYLWNKNKKISALMIIILLSILPSFSPVIVAWFIADRYLYFGSLMFGIICALLTREIQKKYKIQDFMVTATIFLVLFFGIRTAIRTNDFKTNKNLWISTQKASPYSRRVYNNLGDVYSKERNWPLAIENFQKAITVSPNYAEAIHNLGFTYMQAGDLENARKYLMESYQKNPTIFQALYKLAIIENHEGNNELAAQYITKAMEIAPNDPVLIQLANKIQTDMQASN